MGADWFMRVDRLIASTMLSERFKKLMRTDHCRLPFTIGTDNHASYPEAFAASVSEKVLPPYCKLRRVKYLNNVIEQDHRAVRRAWQATMLPIISYGRASYRGH